MITYFIWFLVIFLIIFFILTLYNNLVAKNYFIYNFLMKYKEDRDIFFNECVNNLGESETVYTINMSKFEADSKEARDYLKEIGVRDYKFIDVHFGALSKLSLLENLGFFPDVKTLPEKQALSFMKDLFYGGQSLIDEGIYQYKKRSIKKFAPTYWINKNIGNANDIKINDSVKKKSTIITPIISFLTTLVIDIIGNLATSFIMDIFNLL
ncbi:hypothetical protein [Mammaliicoccus sciuri]|uniref:hypothetical protein n=1 Tax=Mammaliicoccus sciuri TaxID=1296 RepID=UPI002DC0321A|nr:hypothetical protein [Mammaliicoccus sciuri]MEB7783062.1 hypothetical protein [Mammaliicoccus sciuri]